LAQYSLAFLEDTFSEYGEQPEYIMEILFDLFIRRNNKEMGEEKFARLITEIKDVKWQGDILRKLVHLYPEEPHFPAHLARYYLYMAKNLDEANNAADKAIETSERQGKVDSLLYHIKGLCIREKLKDKLNALKAKYTK
jgi:hypothetical protein